MSPERERINYSDYTSLISWVMLLYGCENTIFNLSVIEVKFFVSAYFYSDFAAGVFDVEAFDNLTESPFIDYLCH